TTWLLWAKGVSNVTNTQTSNNEVSSSSGTETDPRPVGDGKMAGFVENFLTYDHSIVHPGPNPNMIVGANGTGKSSIVGLYGLYVKRECNKGSVEIKLQAGGNLVINREMHVENNQSVWLLNGRHSSQKAVEEVKALQIQVSNLCQFLPQEKVGEFAKMTKIELLEATEKSVGPPEMYEFHCKLKIFRTKERELEVSTVLTLKASALEKFKQRKEQNKHGVERYYEKRRHLDMIKMLHKKKPWVEYETACNELEGVKKEREDANKQLKTVRESQAPMLKKIQHIDSQLRPIENQMKDKVRQKRDHLDSKHRERISNTRWMIDDLRAEVANLGDRSDVTPRLGVGNAELKHIHEEKADLRRENDNLNRECKLLHIPFDLVTPTLLSSGWRQNKLFSGNVYEPMMLVISVRSPKNAKYVENHIPFNDLRAFTFQKREDMEKFMTEVRDGQNLRVNSVFAPEESYAFFIFPVCRRFGFFAYLFDAPEEVMSYLCNQYKVHNVPVGTDQTKAMIKTVIEEPYLKVLYTAEEKYSLKKSFYSGKTSTSNSAVWPSQYFTMAEDKRHLEEQISAAEKSMNVLPNRIELRAQKKALSELKGKKRQLEQKISTKQDSLWQMAQGAEEETKAQISAVNSQKVSIVAEFMAHMKLRARLSMEKVYMALETVGMTAEKTKLETDCKEGSAELRVLEQACAMLEQRTACLLEKCKGMLRRAREICNMDPGKSVVPPDLHTVSTVTLAFSQMPNTLDEMDAMLNEERSRAECFTGLRENMVDEYNRREQEIKNLEKELDDKSNALAPTDRTYQRYFSVWIGQIY
uniref:Structural maintenance of chromosomes protein 5 n=1 Tax=Oncorhynchus tshawytscha TaxID=74940 RepID=A0A8C8F1W6_ONCTS